MTRFAPFIALPLILLASCGAEQPAQSDTMSPKGAAAGEVVSAMLLSHHGQAMGEVLVAAGNDGLMVNVMAEGLKPGTYGVHIHTTGKCDAPDFKSAGGHWNPFGKAHGLESETGAHAGDLPNLVIAEGGTGGLSFTLKHATMHGEGGLMDADGAAFVIHAGPDDMKSDPAGNSGERMACGVFAVRESVR